MNRLIGINGGKKMKIFNKKQKKILYCSLITFGYVLIGLVTYKCLKILISFLDAVGNMMPEMSTVHLYWTMIVLLYLVVYVSNFALNVLFKYISHLRNEVRELKYED